MSTLYLILDCIRVLNLASIHFASFSEPHVLLFTIYSYPIRFFKYQTGKTICFKMEQLGNGGMY